MKAARTGMRPRVFEVAQAPAMWPTVPPFTATARGISGGDSGKAHADGKNNCKKFGHE
jgi:hypothetical protein